MRKTMKRFTIALGGLVLAILLTMLAGCDEPQQACETPEPVRIAAENVVKNYGGNGSCFYAVAGTICNMTDRPKLARWIRRYFRGGQHDGAFKREMQRKGVKVAIMRSGDFGWVRVMLESGQPIGVGYAPRDKYPPNMHEQLAYRIDDKRIWISDPNYGPGYGVLIEKFKRDWDGTAFALPL